MLGSEFVKTKLSTSLAHLNYQSASIFIFKYNIIDSKNADSMNVLVAEHNLHNQHVMKYQ